MRMHGGASWRITMGFVEPRLDPPRDPEVICECSECGRPIYDGELALHVTDWGWICSNCIRLKTREVGYDNLRD